MDMETGLSLRE